MSTQPLHELIAVFIPNLCIPERHISFEFEGILLDFFASDYLAASSSQYSIFEWRLDSNGIIIFENPAFLGISGVSLLRQVERFLRPVIDFLSLLLNVRLLIERVFVFQRNGETYHFSRGAYTQISTSYTTPPIRLMPALYCQEAEYYLPIHTQNLANDLYRDHFHIIVNEFLQAKVTNLLELQIVLFWFSIENFARFYALWALGLSRTGWKNRVKSLRGICHYIQQDLAPCILHRPLTQPEFYWLKKLYDLRNAIAHDGEDISKRNIPRIIRIIQTFQKLMTRILFDAFHIPSQDLNWEERSSLILLDYNARRDQVRSTPQYQDRLNPIEQLSDEIFRDGYRDGTLFFRGERIPLRIRFLNPFSGEFRVNMRYYPRILQKNESNVYIQSDSFSISFDLIMSRINLRSGSDELTGTFVTSLVLLTS
ncbi:MAG: hypothetical protein RBG13Loki_0653 [Promethearchaeota archaeon CR_4]|nr:MAG: hypothetical protein RBG13Loki_0653 [Candidatus Lokiarchaeota archaeon CR_4]